MAKSFISASNGNNLKFGEASLEQLTDFLFNLNQRNKENLRNLPKNSGDFKTSAIIADIFRITQQLGLDPLVGYQAVELLQRFMVKHLTGYLSASPSLSDDQPIHNEELVEKFPLILFSCIRLASKLSFYSQMIDSNVAVRLLYSLGHSVTKQGVLELELMVLKGLEFRLDFPNPLTYVETLLEVLRHNEPCVPVQLLYHQCRHVLLFITLQRKAFYESLLITSLQTSSSSSSPSQKQREKFVTVTEDYMLLGVGVISVSAFILCFRMWQQVVAELSHMTGITKRSITDFTFVTVKLIIDPHPTSSHLTH
ncbi:cyclin N-terminal domain-containing protein 1 [Gouania willdenowi]|uniref:Cyclin N-terminal domain-containing protein n=1 Tax=Gouania willdenowi TaxID=441366 RepID=A0A8C5GCU7_GOUWI|nr:cyclin N-terminal domain-containing protein 1 [Gouania willdenowi]